jgi:hypothetical protein
LAKQRVSASVAVPPRAPGRTAAELVDCQSPHDDENAVGSFTSAIYSVPVLRLDVSTITGIVSRVPGFAAPLHNVELLGCCGD